MAYGSTDPGCSEPVLTPKRKRKLSEIDVINRLNHIQTPLNERKSHNIRPQAVIHKARTCIPWATEF